MTAKVIIALGANLDNPQQNLARAAAKLAELSQSTLECSSVWQSAPEGFSEAVPEFCNAVVAMAVETEPLELLQHLQKIEALFGRIRTPGTTTSRELDLDIVDWSGQVHELPGLLLPHPRAMQRRFVLLPLQEIEPGFRFPGSDLTLDELIALAPENPMRRLTRLIPLV